MSTRAEKTAATRGRILQAARALVAEGNFHTASMETVAKRAGVTRVTLYRTFGSRQALLESLFWEMMAVARLDRIDAAHALPDVHDALREVLRANCEMFAALGASMPLAIDLARSDADMRAIMDATYYGRRPQAMGRLAGRMVRDGVAAEGWTKTRIADALMVLSSYESFETLVRRGHSPAQAAAVLYRMAGAFLI
jgi:AcrR family transcriptional regulator